VAEIARRIPSRSIAGERHGFMIDYVSIILLGLFLGMRHSTDPDHVIAVATIVTRYRKLFDAAAVGIAWGIGHTLTVSLVGAGIILFNLVISPRLGLGMELAVGTMLIVLGLMNVGSLRQAMTAADPGGAVHPHPHQHDSTDQPLARLDRAFGGIHLYRHLRPFVVGTIHGLAGSAAVALLVLTTIRNPRWAVAYLLLFGAGTIAGMMLITMTMASTIRMVAGGREWFSGKLRLASGLVSLAFGLFLAYQICFARGFLTHHPRWTPH